MVLLRCRHIGGCAGPDAGTVAEASIHTSIAPQKEIADPFFLLILAFGLVGLEPAGPKKGLRGAHRPVSTLSQNGYGEEVHFQKPTVPRSGFRIDVQYILKLLFCQLQAAFACRSRRSPPHVR